MKLLELISTTLNEQLFAAPQRQLLTEAGTPHIEDLVIAKDGGKKAIEELEKLKSNPETASIKWDGSIHLVFGRNKKGKIVLVDVYQFDKVAKAKDDTAFTTIEEYDKAKTPVSQRPNLWEAEKIMRPILEKIVPSATDKYWGGDLLWVGKLTPSDGFFKFQPSTVRYEVEELSPLGEKIKKSSAGFALHTSYRSLTDEGSPISGTGDLIENSGMVLLTGEMKGKPKININSALLNKTKKYVIDNTPLVNQFIETLTKSKSKMILTSISSFISQMIDEGDVKTDIIPRYVEFLTNKLSTEARDRLIGTEANPGWLLQDEGGIKGLKAIWEMWAMITDLKIHIKKEYDLNQKDSEVRAYINDLESHEGYVFGGGAYKLVDRLGFTKALRDKYKPSPDEVKTKSKMPIAAFCFGRMNPPTLGHDLVMDKTLSEGGKNSFIFISGSHDPSANPLPFDTKLAFIKKIYPKYFSYIVRDPNITTPILAANYLYDMGFRHITFVGGSDRLGKAKGSVEKVLNSWNSGWIRTHDYARGPEGREHVVLNFVSSGQRDVDSAGLDGISGTKARTAASKNDQKQFDALTGVSPGITVAGRNLFQATREAMGLDNNPTQNLDTDREPILGKKEI